MKKYQIVSKWNTESALQILEIDSTPKTHFSFVKVIFLLLVVVFAYCILSPSRHSTSNKVKEEKKELVIPAPILNMKSNPHAAEDLNTLSDL